MIRALATIAITAVVGLLIGFAFLIVASGENARSSARARLAARAELTGGFISATVRDLKTSETLAVRSRVVDGRLDAASFLAVVNDLDLQGAVHLDRSGHVLDVFPDRPELIGTQISAEYGGPTSAVAGGRAVSNVFPSAGTGQPVITLATPIGVGKGRTTFSGGYDVAETSVAPYLRNTFTQPGGQAFVLDAAGALVAGAGSTGSTTLRSAAPLLARSLARSPDGNGTFDAPHGARVFTSAAVGGTPWRIVVSVRSAELYVSAGEPITTAWVVFGGFVAAGLAVALLLVVLWRRSTTLAVANAQLEVKQTEVYRLLDSEQEFVARSSHELRTPLTSVIGYLEEVIGGTEPLSETQRGYLDVAHRNSRRLHTLVDDLLLLHETETNGVELEPEPVDLGDLLCPLVHEYEILCLRAGLRFEAEMPDIIPSVFVDRSRTEQVLTNLLGNAVKFTPRGGVVAVRVEIADDGLRISVCDTGMGIPPGELDQVFERFYRSSSAEKRKIPGTGLGLPIARAIAETQHGTLLVTSQVGVGSVFTLTVPFSSATLEVATWHMSS